MALRAADLALAGVPAPDDDSLNSKSYLPHTASVGPFAVQKNPPAPAGADSQAEETIRWEYLVELQTHHNLSLAERSGKMVVQSWTDQMLGACRLLPDLMNLAPGLLKSQVPLHCTA